MKKCFFYATMAVTLLFVTGCKDDDESNTEQVIPQETEGSKLLIEENNILQFQPEDFVNTVGNGKFASGEGWNISPDNMKIIRPILKILNKVVSSFVTEQNRVLDERFEAEAGAYGQKCHCWQMESYGFTYRSKSARGEDVVLSGRVTFPNHKTSGIGHKVKSLTLDMHPASRNVSSVPSRTLGLFTLRAYFDQAVIQPDGQGLGVNLDKDYYCTISADVLARQMADCTLAALEVMRRHGVTLIEGGRSICTGYSLGAAVPLSFAKYYETEASESFRKAVRLKDVYTGCGPMDFETTIRYLSDNPKYNAMLSKTLLFSLAALSPEQLYGYQAQDFVNKNLLDIPVVYNGRTMSYFEAEARYFFNVVGTDDDKPNPQKLSEILASDMMTRDGKLNGASPKTQALMRILTEQNNLSGWLPTTNIYLMHCKQDDGIPVEQALRCYEQLSNGGKLATVHYKETSILPLLAELAKLRKAGFMHVVACLFFFKEYINEDMSEGWKD